MVKSFQDSRGGRGGFRGGNSRGGSMGFNRNNQRGGGGGRFDQGPPGYVIPYCSYEHPCEQQIVLKVTDLTRVPKFNRAVYLENKAKVGTVDQILGPIKGFYFTAKLQEGIKASSLKKGQTLYMNPEDLLPLDRFTQKSKPTGPRGSSGPGASRGGFRGAPRGGFGGAPRGGSFRGAPRGGPRGFGRGAPRGRSY